MTIETENPIALENDPEQLQAGAEGVNLAAADPRSEANIARRKALGLVERDEHGRLLPGSNISSPVRAKGSTITILARQHTDRAIALLAGVMDDPKAPQAARVTAAQALLDRGWGKAPIQIDLNVRAKFDDFLRDVGASAVYEREHGHEQVAAMEVTDVVIKAALDESGPTLDETDGAE